MSTSSSRPTLAAIALLLVGLAAGTLAAETSVVKLASLIPSGSFWDRALKTMAAEWRERTEGRVQLRIYPGGVAGDDPDVLRKMRIGQLQAATVTVSGLSEVDRAFALFEIPMFFESYEEFFFVLEGLTPELEARLAEEGYVLMHWVHAGWVYFFSSTPVSTFEELRALEVFQWAGDERMAALWREHGFRPVPLAGTDIAMGLQTGMFATLPATPIAALSLQWFRLAPNMVDLGLTPLLGATLVDARTWNKLDEADREAVLASAHAAGDTFQAEIEARDQEALREMEQRGLTITRVVGTEREAAWREAAFAFAEDMREAFVPPKLYDRALELRDAYRAGADTKPDPED